MIRLKNFYRLFDRQIIALRLKILKNLDRKEFLKLKKYRAYPRSVVKLIN